MDDYTRLKASTAKTVGELVALLLTLNQDAKLSCTGPDIGGYGVSDQDYVAINAYTHQHCDWVAFSHHEAEAWELYNKGKLTEEQYNEFAK